MPGPTVSVLMPVYNAERYVRETLESILAQTYSDYEFMIIDDGSTDGTSDILSAASRVDSRIRLHRRPRTGYVRALNEGLGLATGEYVARMDADDIALPQRFERQVAFLQSHPDVAVVGTFAENIDDAGRTLGTIKPPFKPATNLEVKWRLLFGNALVHPTVMMRRQIVLEIGKYDIRCEPSEDYELWSRLSRLHPIVNLPEVHLKYRVHTSSVSSVNSSTQSTQSRKISERNLAQLGITLSAQQLSSLKRAYGGRSDFTPEDVIGAASVLPDVYGAFLRKYTARAEDIRSIREWVEMQVMRGSRNCANRIMAKPISAPAQLACLKPWRWCSPGNHFLLTRAIKSLAKRAAR